MNTFISILIVTILLHVFSFGQDGFKRERIFPNDTSRAFTSEIPIYNDGVNKGDTDYMYKFIRNDAIDLNLDRIDTGYNILQIRIWLGHSLAIKRNAVIIKKAYGKWFGQLVTFTQGHEEKTGKEFIDKKETKKVEPKSGWDKFTKDLARLKILTLPHSENIQGYKGCGGKDRIDYYFEIATKSLFRFYYYCNPANETGTFWQAKNVLEFSNILEKEFRFQYTK